ncbi:hypothetical protein [Saccharopolyspora spinosa]|uniref:hypothetical protein n=1 Tax=Saccharopolyspora spinosa TaxID=60894 RepID=UPI0007C5385F|nr:hypothetical protein [Saccharopolyspora spinosa]
MVLKDHLEQVCVGHPIKSGSFLREGVALVVGDCPGPDLDEPNHAVGEVVSGDDLGVDVQLAEDDLRHSALHSVTAASVEALMALR